MHNYGIAIVTSVNRASLDNVKRHVLHLGPFVRDVNALVGEVGRIVKVFLCRTPGFTIEEIQQIDCCVSLLPSVEYVDSDDSDIVKRKRQLGIRGGLGFFWFSGFERAFELDSIDYSFYFPVDVDWTAGPTNTVVDPGRFAQLIEAVTAKPSLIAGSYRTTDHPKEAAEAMILGYVLGAFADHPDFEEFREHFGYFDDSPISRPRTEFFGISRKFFNAFQPIGLRPGQPAFASDDPTLELCLQAILENRNIVGIDLGSYATASTGGQPMKQLSRVKQIIGAYRGLFQNWTPRATVSGSVQPDKC